MLLGLEELENFHFFQGTVVLRFTGLTSVQLSLTLVGRVGRSDFGR